LTRLRSIYADFMLTGLLMWIDAIDTVPLLEAGDPLVMDFTCIHTPHTVVDR
jgi:hypothetical protein